jgi:carbon storage regulator
MLVLTRRIDEKIVVNDNIVITVLAIDGEKVKLGIAAPREVTVLRYELWQAIQEQSQIAEFLLKQPETPGIENLRQFLASEASESSEEGHESNDQNDSKDQKDQDKKS